MKRYAVLMIMFAFCLPTVSYAQYFYVNSYIQPAGNNAIYKIDATTKSIADSIILPVTGQFITGNPSTIRLNREQSFLISVLNNGLSGNNSKSVGICTAYYCMIFENDFRLLSCDSMPGNQITNLKPLLTDSLSLKWIDSSGQWYDGLFRFDRFNRRIFNIRQRAMTPQSEEHTLIGNYSDPLFIGSNQRATFYVDLVDGHLIRLFSSNRGNVITRDSLISDLDNYSSIFGFDSTTNTIYAFQIKFVLYSSNPPFTSPDSLKSRVVKINANDFSIIESLPISLGKAYIAQEIGIAVFFNGNFAFNFSKSDGYSRYDPEYVFIFDTRNNQATWLRVGWR